MHLNRGRNGCIGPQSWYDSAYYDISYVTVEVYTLSLKERTKLKGLLEVVSSSQNSRPFPPVGMKRVCSNAWLQECPSSRRLSFIPQPHLPYMLPRSYHSLRAPLHFPPLPDFISLLLQEIARSLSPILCCPLSAGYTWMLVSYLTQTPPLSDALGAMDLSQMFMQAVWDRLAITADSAF
ncbi:hypothetical protein BJV77DRAFT_1115995 [Russula vinacea]|nr:hypothetical protein BJV77DRAFT_1115995 [Russula vinacea]